MDARRTLLARIDTWEADRQYLSEQESNGDYPAPGKWEGSDDTAVDLLREAAAMLRNTPPDFDGPLGIGLIDSF